MLFKLVGDVVLLISVYKLFWIILLRSMVGRDFTGLVLFFFDIRLESWNRWFFRVVGDIIYGFL